MNEFLDGVVVRTDFVNYPGSIFFFKNGKFLFEISSHTGLIIWLTVYAYPMSGDLESFFGLSYGIYHMSMTYHSLIQKHFEIKDNGENDYTREVIR